MPLLLSPTRMASLAKSPVVVDVLPDPPSVTEGTVADTVHAGDPTKLDDKVTNPADGMSGVVKGKDGNEAPGAEVTVDPETSEITVSVPKGTGPGDYTV